MKWSILICAIPERQAKLQKLKAELERQMLALNLGAHIEIVIHETPLFIDGGPEVGTKRNWLLNNSTGEYVGFIDDDDIIRPTYIKDIYEGILTDPDVVCFNVAFKSAGKDQITHFSIKHSQNVNAPDKRVPENHHHIRMPNHIMVVKREHAIRAGFPDKNFGEDTQYGVRLRGPRVTSLLKTEYKVEKVLYEYHFDRKKSRTHQFNPLAFPVIDEDPILLMDVVIVSDGRLHRTMTQNAINSISGERTNVIVLEKEALISYDNCSVYKQQEPFNYNQCLNDGAGMGNSDLICFSNNDVIFPDHFAEDVYKLVKEKKCDVVSFQTQTGFINPEIISGFCFVMTRDAYRRIIKLNENYKFWCADNVTTEQIKECGLFEFKSDIKVLHFTSATLQRLDKGTYELYTKKCVQDFNRDFNKNIFNWGASCH